jgi:hypothetical protein
MEEVIRGPSRDAEEEIIDGTEQGTFSSFVGTINQVNVVLRLWELERKIAEVPKGGNGERIEAHLYSEVAML